MAVSSFIEAMLMRTLASAPWIAARASDCAVSMSDANFSGAADASDRNRPSKSAAVSATSSGTLAASCNACSMNGARSSLGLLYAARTPS